MNFKVQGHIRQNEWNKTCTAKICKANYNRGVWVELEGPNAKISSGCKVVTPTYTGEKIRTVIDRAIQMMNERQIRITSWRFKGFKNEHTVEEIEHEELILK
jgi:hypothetical protein